MAADGVSAVPPTMVAVVTTGVGGTDKLSYQRTSTPAPTAGQVLVRVLACGVNNTDVNTRVGWYQAGKGGDAEGAADGWDGGTVFPFIQGTDCCGVVAAVGEPADGGLSRAELEALVGKRVLVRPNDPMTGVWMGSNSDGAFAQFVAVDARNAFPIDSDWTDAELGSLPCSYGTAEAMLDRAAVSDGDRVLVTGASGGVGSALVQLAKRRGAAVTAICGAAKAAAVRGVGADRVLAGRFGSPEWAALREELADSFDVVADNVGGDAFPDLLDFLARKGRYVTCGALAGPVVSLDLRTLYLRDLTLLGSTAWAPHVFPNLVRYVEAGELRPLVAATYPLRDIAKAQQDFQEKLHVGKLVLIPPKVSEEGDEEPPPVA